MKMQLFTIILILSITLLGCNSVEDAYIRENNERIYLYTYEYNTETLIEDHYIVLDSVGEELVGRYYGTSDEFDDAREGYYPGFFLLEMKDIEIEENNIKFTLELKEDEIFSYPIDISYRSTDDIDLMVNPIWKSTKLSGVNEYYGTIENGKIILNEENSTRVFNEIE